MGWIVTRLELVSPFMALRNVLARISWSQGWMWERPGRLSRSAGLGEGAGRLFTCQLRQSASNASLCDTPKENDPLKESLRWIDIFEIIADEWQRLARVLTDMLARDGYDAIPPETNWVIANNRLDAACQQFARTKTWP